MIAAAQGALFDPVEVTPVYKLKCQACLILIGPGYHEQEVWIDGRGRWICRGCARWIDDHDCEPLASAEEVAQYSMPKLYRLLHARTHTREVS